MLLRSLNLPQAVRDAIAACRGDLKTLVLFSALINLLYLAPTIYMIQIYDRVVPTRGGMTLLWLTLVVAFALITLAGLETIRSRVMMWVSLKLDAALSDRILGSAVAPGQQASSGQVLREFDVLRQTLNGPLLTALFDAPWAPIYLIVATIIHPLLGGMIVLGGIVLVILAVLNERAVREGAKLAFQANAAAYGALENLARHAELVRSLGMRAGLVARLGRDRAVGIGATTEAHMSGLRYGSYIRFCRMLLQSLSLAAGAMLAIFGSISVGTIIAASILLSRALQPVELLVSNWSALLAARRALTLVSSVIEAGEAEDRPRHVLPAPTGKVALTGVSVLVGEDNLPLLKDIGLELHPGEVLALIGPSGAGKSTLARVLSGAIPPSNGDLRLNGARYEDWDPQVLSRCIGYMPQQSQLLPGSVAQNISRFAESAGEDAETVGKQVLKAAQAAGVHEMILRLPGGYDAPVGGDGINLSGGQLQRIALARALYGDPVLLVLDEPSSSLDVDGEFALLRSVEAAKQRGAAVVMVAHRAAMLGGVDRIALLRDGTIVQQGMAKDVIAALRADAERASKAAASQGISNHG